MCGASLNAGAIFYLADHVSTLSDGVKRARASIRTGDALRKMMEWAVIQADAGGKGIQRLKTVAGLAGLEKRVAELI